VPRRSSCASAGVRPLAHLNDPDDPLLEAAILSTCNRVEVYGAARSRASREKLTVFLARYHGLDPSEFTGSVYVHRDAEVAHHLSATSAGLHSLVLCEAQIQGQVRRALAHAISAGTAGPELQRMVESAISAGRQVRSRTTIPRGVGSVSHAGIELVRQRLGTLSQSTVLLIGAGTVGELAAKHLIKHRPHELLVLGRGPERAMRLAERYGGRALVCDQLGEALARSIVVISSTSAPHAILHRRQLEIAVGGRGGRRSEPLVLVDLATPRDVDAAVAGLTGLEVYTIDDLRPLVERALTQRGAELAAAYSLVRDEVARFTGWLRRRETAAALRSLGTEVEWTRATALERTCRKLPLWLQEGFTAWRGRDTLADRCARVPPQPIGPTGRPPPDRTAGRRER
jgi:glutamyl-tRNA reductase